MCRQTVPPKRVHHSTKPRAVTSPPPQKKTVILGRQKAGTSGCDILNVTQKMKIWLHYLPPIRSVRIQ